MSLKRTKLVQLGIDCTHIWPTIYHVSDVQFINDNTTGNECGTLVSIWLIPNLGVMNMKTLLPSNKYTETLSPLPQPCIGSNSTRSCFSLSRSFSLVLLRWFIGSESGSEMIRECLSLTLERSIVIRQAHFSAFPCYPAMFRWDICLDLWTETALKKSSVHDIMKLTRMSVFFSRHSLIVLSLLSFLSVL